MRIQYKMKTDNKELRDLEKKLSFHIDRGVDDFIDEAVNVSLALKQADQRGFDRAMKQISSAGLCSEQRSAERERCVKALENSNLNLRYKETERLFKHKLRNGLTPANDGYIHGFREAIDVIKNLK